MGKLVLILVFTLVIQYNQVAGQTGPTDEKITVSFEKITVKELLNFLEHAHKLNFSYSSDNTPLSKVISIHAYEMELALFLDMLCFESGLSYNIIDNQIVLRQGSYEIDLSSDVTRNLIGSKKANSISLPEQLDASDLFHEKPMLTSVEKVNPLPPANLEKHTPYRNPTFPTDELSVARKLSPRQSFNFRKKKMASFGIGMIGSYVQFKPDFHERPNKVQKFSQGTNFSTGIVGIISPGEIFSGAIGIQYATKNYFLEYNYQLGNSEDPVLIPDHTKLFVSYLAIPMSLNYRLFKAMKFSLYVSGGISPELLIREKESTIYLNSDKKETAFFSGGNTKFLLGGAAGVMLWYDLSRTIHVFLKPESIYYLTAMNKDLMRKPPRLLKISAGLSMRLWQ